MPTYTPATTTHYVIHNADNSLVLLQTVEPGDAIGTGQSHVEVFSDRATAIARATELGWVAPPPEDGYLSALSTLEIEATPLV
jgi:hypothetical protein